MDFVEWCNLALAKLVELGQVSSAVYAGGASGLQLGQAVFDQSFSTDPGTASPTRYDALMLALQELQTIGLVEQRTGGPRWRVTAHGRSCAKDIIPLWGSLCSLQLNDDLVPLLSAINRLSERMADDHAWLEPIPMTTIPRILEERRDELSLRAQIQELVDEGMLKYDKYQGMQAVRASYSSLVWETRQAFTARVKFIDDLVETWETVNVDFKRELHINTNDDKAELVKDLIGLANPQVTGQRWLIIGFDPKEHTYFGPPDPKITQDQIEQILSVYTRPHLQVRYELADYREGKVGLIEILRDSKRVPYAVGKSVSGAKRRVTAGQIFVRHSSQTVEIPEYELQILQKEAAQAQEMRQQPGSAERAGER